jgi:hypothetical protein
LHFETITEPLKIFDGTARDAAKRFAANLNFVIARTGRHRAGPRPDGSLGRSDAEP